VCAGKKPARHRIQKCVSTEIVEDLVRAHKSKRDGIPSRFSFYTFTIHYVYMKLISWNVNGIRASQKKGALDDIFKHKPDILAIQETKCDPSQLPEGKFAPPGYTAYFDSATSRKGYSGVAIYTKEVPHTVEQGLGTPAFDHEGRMLTAHFDDFVFVTCYFPNGGRDEEHFAFKLDYYKAFLKKMNQLQEEYETVIFCGDLTNIQTLKYLAESFTDKIYIVGGNADSFYLSDTKKFKNLVYKEDKLEFKIDNQKIIVVHKPTDLKKIFS
jgi:exodeoxyribonuclease III